MVGRVVKHRVELLELGLAPFDGAQESVSDGALLDPRIARALVRHARART